MTTTNQKIVAEALHQARINGFDAGLHFLKNNGITRFKDEGIFPWFATKCMEHKIPSPLFPMELEIHIN